MNIKEQLEEVINNSLHRYAQFVITENPGPLQRRARKNEMSSLIADEVLKVVVEEIILKIENFHLWSKGTVEGTRQDIIFKLKNLYEK